MRSRFALIASLVVLAACAPGRYLPVGTPARYGDNTADGIALLLRGPEARVRSGLVRAFEANGYAVRAETAGVNRLESAAYRLGGDTTLVVRAEIMPEDPSGGGVAVVLSGEYSVPSAGIRRARVVQRPGEQNPLYARLGAVADSTRRLLASAP